MCVYNAYIGLQELLENWVKTGFFGVKVLKPMPASFQKVHEKWALRTK